MKMQEIAALVPNAHIYALGDEARYLLVVEVGTLTRFMRDKLLMDLPKDSMILEVVDVEKSVKLLEVK